GSASPSPPKPRASSPGTTPLPSSGGCCCGRSFQLSAGQRRQWIENAKARKGENAKETNKNRFFLSSFRVFALSRFRVLNPLPNGPNRPTTMRLALLADVHANLEALSVVLGEAAARGCEG